MMSEQVRPDPSHKASWDERYRSDAAAFGLEPNVFLTSLRDRLPRWGDALVPADGQGRNGIWLAERGLRVLSIDISSVAVGQARALAAQRGVVIDARQGDLLETRLPGAAFDVVAAIYIHLPAEQRTRLHRRLAHALRPGGVLVIEAFAPGQLALRERFHSGGPPRLDMLYGAETLRADFVGLEPERLEEVEVELAEGSHHRGRAAVVRGVFVRPGI